MDIRQTKKTLRTMLRLRSQSVHLPMLLWGGAGTGKTSIPEQLCQELTQETGEDYQCVVLKGAQGDGAGDLLGLPTIKKHYPCPTCIEQDPGMDRRFNAKELAEHVHKHGQTYSEVMQNMEPYMGLVEERQVFALTDIWPTGGKGILVVDEINRFPQDLQNSILGLVQERRMELNGYKVPEGFIVMATANPPTDDYIGVEEMDFAMATRFLHIQFQPSPDDWADYMMKKHGSDPVTRRMVRHFTQNPEHISLGGQREMLDVIKDLKGVPRQADSLVAFCRHLGDDDILLEVAQGYLGLQAGSAFYGVMKSAMEPLTAEEVLTQYDVVSDDVAELAKTSEEVLLSVWQEIHGYLEKGLTMTTNETRNFRRFLDAMGADLRESIVDEMRSGNKTMRDCLKAVRKAD